MTIQINIRSRKEAEKLLRHETFAALVSIHEPVNWLSGNDTRPLYGYDKFPRSKIHIGFDDVERAIATYRRHARSEEE